VNDPSNIKTTSKKVDKMQLTTNGGRGEGEEPHFHKVTDDMEKKKGWEKEKDL